MPVPVSPASWTGSLLWLLSVVAVAFAVSWVVATRLRVKRAPYIAVLSVVTAAMAVGYVAWLGVGTVDLLTARWGWGLLAAALCGGFMAFGMTRMPVTQRLAGGRLVAGLLWDGVVYGLAEGVLLSALPVLITWQMVHSLGWSGVGGGIARWTLPILASVVVIVVHHLGYADYRNRLLVPITAGCGLLSLGYLVTASPVAPALGHVIGHMSGLLHGAELPPAEHLPPAPAAPATQPLVHAS